MGNKIYETDSLFDTANSADYQLLVEVGANYYSYAVLDEELKLKAISFADTSILSATMDSSILTLTFKSTKISLHTQNFTFLPTQLYNDGDEGKYAQFLNVNESPTLHTYQFLNIQIKSLNTFDESKLQALKNLFPSAEFYPQYIPFIEGAQTLLKDNYGKSLIINKKADNLEILILKENKLQFYNVFECLNHEEILYYLLSTCQHNKIDPQEISLHVAGHLTEQSNAYSLLQKAFRNIQILKNQSLPSNAGEFSQVELHQFYSLLNLSQCG